MAFTLQNWGRISSSANNAITVLQNGVSIGSPNIFSYISSADAQAAIAGANYFAPVVVELNVGDLIYAVDSTNVPVQYQVTAVNVAAQTVTVINAAVAGGDVIGPAVSTNTAIALFNGVTGKLLMNSVILVSGAGAVTGVLSLANGVGTAALPSYTFTGRTNTGMWSSAANTLDFSTTGLRGFQVDTSPALAVDYLSAISAVTGAIGLPLLQAKGTDANIDVGMLPKGTGGLSIRGATNSGSVKLWNQANTFWAQIKAAAMASNITWAWPAVDGAAGNVMTTDGAGNLSLVPIAGAGWVDQVATPANMVANTSYIADTAGLLTFNMPAVVTQGTEFEIAGNGAGGWLVQMNAGQTANLNSTPTTVAGSLASTNRYNTIKILCTVANTTFTVIRTSGVITVA